MTKRIPKHKFVSVTLLAFVATACSVRAQDLVDSVSKGPITADGNAAGSPTGLLINLDGSLDPSVEGRTLLAGKTIKFELPEGFVDTGNVPILDAFSSPACGPNNFQCSTVVLLQGWPQHPILPSTPNDDGPRSPQYSLSHESDTNTFTITADVDITPGLAVPGPGIKGLVLVLNGFTNPDAGTYDISVMAETGPNGSLETGSGQVTILPQMQPSIHVSSQFNPGTPNTIYQTASPGKLTPLAFDFLVWDEQGMPLLDVEISPTASPTEALLVKSGNRIGSVFINAPEGATGFEVFTEAPSLLAQSVNPADAGRLTAFFRAGTELGDYDVTFTLDDASLPQMSARMFVNVVPEPSSTLLSMLGMFALFCCRPLKRVGLADFSF